jgi:hypothetical protein
MLIFGKSVSDWREKAAYAQDKADNEFAKIHEIRCEGIDDVDMAFTTMAAFAADTGCKKFLYHATINLNPSERLTKEQWMKAVDTLEANLKLTEHHRVVFEHIKKDRQHYHIVWSRLPPDGKGPAVNMGNDFFVHQRTAKALETEFGLKQAPRKDKDKQSKKKREINDRNSRKRVDPDKVTKDVTRIYKGCRTSKEFIRSLTIEGYTLTRGKNGSYVIVEKQGGYHGLLRRIEGAKLVDVRKKFPDLDKTPLPTLSAVLKSRRPSPKVGYRRASFISCKPVSSYMPKAYVPTFRVPVSLAALIAQAKSHHPKPERKYYPPPFKRKSKKKDENEPSRPIINYAKIEYEERLAYAWEHGELDILAQFGIFLPADFFQP